MLKSRSDGRMWGEDGYRVLEPYRRERSKDYLDALYFEDSDEQVDEFMEQEGSGYA